jgi:hypothetical protein
MLVPVVVGVLVRATTKTVNNKATTSKKATNFLPVVVPEFVCTSGPSLLERCVSKMSFLYIQAISCKLQMNGFNALKIKSNAKS